ncbi:ferredoxin [Xenococcus sp. PCC 7305]|uniref:2Fe-2S iron-sulfur cluster-binding protein n=1 Tax=Xenococcus sp. PCC 7305 TaxID=102125 RepID=UPI0002ABAA00|nr:2Fe-2S iron-sulfur cluster-binding protein [Xenococcus sp. PCC 7305]ELS03042.1 ferredoxin [Xenococcus sp. PCC 7305]
MSIQVRFLPDNVITNAEAGEPMLEVAARAGVLIPTGCLMGSCHACEVELGDGTPVCACISSIPGDQPELTINLYDDPTW